MRPSLGESSFSGARRSHGTNVPLGSRPVPALSQIPARSKRDACNSVAIMKRSLRCGACGRTSPIKPYRASFPHEIENAKRADVAGADAPVVGREIRESERVDNMNEKTGGETDVARAATPGTPVFRALDPELPGLAARAAFQLDNLRLKAEGKASPEAKTDAIDKFARRLQALEIPPPAADRKALLDPVTTTLLHDAVIQAHRVQAQQQALPTSLDDMLAEVGRVTERLVQIQGFQQQVAAITALRNFCLAVSDLASSKQRLIRSPRPPYHGPKASRL